MRKKNFLLLITKSIRRRMVSILKYPKEIKNVIGVMKSASSFKLDYGEAMIRLDDLNLLIEPNWINDNILEFCCEYNEKNSNSDIMFLRPAMVHLLTNCNDPETARIAAPSLLPQANVIFIPVNDNSQNIVGGSHWSLLVYSRKTETFYYYDSLNGYNLSSARRTHARLSPLISNFKTSLVQVDTPKQINGYDCGVYVICITEEILRRINANEKMESLDQWKLLNIVTPKNVTEKRSLLYKLMIALERESRS